MGMFNEKWVSKCNPCRKCKYKPSVQRNGKSWIVYCHHCHPGGKGLSNINVFINPYEAVRKWNDDNAEEYFSAEEIVKKTEQERHKALSEFDALDIENIGSIDGTEYAKMIKKFAARLAAHPYNDISVATEIHMLFLLAESLSKYKEDKHE